MSRSATALATTAYARLCPSPLPPVDPPRLRHPRPRAVRRADRPGYHSSTTTRSVLRAFVRHFLTSAMVGGLLAFGLVLVMSMGAGR